MTLGQGVGALLILAAVDQWVRGLVDARVAVFSPLITALQASCLAGVLILVAVLTMARDRVRLWQVLVSAGCLSGLLERVIFGQVSLPFAFASSEQWDWTAFAFADMYIAAGAVAAYWKHELEKHEEKGEGENASAT